MSKPDSIAACDGSVDARRMVRARQRVGGALQDRLVHGRADARQRVGAQAVLADDHDVADRGAARLRRARGCRRRRRGRRRGRRGDGRAAGGAGLVGLAAAGDAGRRAARRPAGTRRLSSARPTSVSDGLAAFSICLNLAPSEFHVRRRARLARLPRRSRASRSWFRLTGPTQAGLRVTVTWWPLFVWPLSWRARAGLGCAHVEPAPCASDKDCKLNRLCDAGRCVWPGDTARPVRAARGAAADRRCRLPQYAVEPAQAMFRFGPTHRGRSPFVAAGHQAGRSGGRSRPAGPSCRHRPSRPTGRCWSGRTTASCTTSRATARSSGRTRRATSSSARPPWHTTGPSTSAPTTTTFTR